MKILSYSGESVLTSDRIGDAVIDYARALATESAADVVDIPVVEGDHAGVARLLIGPSSQLIAIPSVESDTSLDDEETFRELTRRIRGLSPSRALATSSSDWTEDAIDFDFL